MPPPTIQRLFAFCDELVALIDGGHAGDRSGLVIEDLVSDMGRDAEPGHPRDAGPAQIVNSPVLHAAHRIQLCLALTEVLERSRARREHEWPEPLPPLEHAHGLR